MTAIQPPQNEPAVPGEAGLNRRELLGFSIAGPVLSLGIGLGAATPSQAALLQVPGDVTDIVDYGDLVFLATLPTLPLIRLTVESTGRARLELPRLESGQGISTACAMMVAEDLDLPISQVDVVSSDARPELLFNQQTGGSTSMRVFSFVLPQLAAQARAKLMQAAAQQWGVHRSSLSTRQGVVIGSGGQTASYGSLSSAAQSVLPILGVPTKPASQYQVMGKPTRRVDALDIVTGKKKFTLDQDVPDAKPTMVRRPPTIRGTFRRIRNEGVVRRMPGVIGIAVIPGGGAFVPNPPGVAVMAETFGQAWDAVRALDVEWGPGSIDGESDASIQRKLRQATVPFLLPPCCPKWWRPSSNGPPLPMRRSKWNAPLPMCAPTAPRSGRACKAQLPPKKPLHSIWACPSVRSKSMWCRRGVPLAGDCFGMRCNKPFRCRGLWAGLAS